MPERDTTTDEPVIRFDKVVKNYGHHAVINELDFSVAPGEKVTIIGPSGSGKSTVLRILMTLEKINGGVIRIGGEPLWHEQRNGGLVPAGEKQVPDKFFLKDGDTVVMMGDSITEQLLYSNYVEMWSVSRFPTWKLTFRNVGIGGDRSTGGVMGLMGPGEPSTPRNSASAAANSVMSRKRSSPFFASARRQMASRRGSSPGVLVDGVTTASFNTRCRSRRTSLSSNGRECVKRSYRMTPRL